MAKFQFEFPDCVATTVQAPTVTKDTVVALNIVHTEGVEEEKFNANPEEAFPFKETLLWLKVKEGARTLKEMVWLDFTITKVAVADAADVVTFPA